MQSTSWTIPGAEGQPIYGNTHRPAPSTKPRGVIVLCHGFKGYKDYGVFPRLATACADAGMIACRFNFSHSGVTEDYSTFARPELFIRDTWGRQIHDLAAVARRLRTGALPGAESEGLAGLPMIWFGHSRGGVTVLLTAARAFAPGEYDLPDPPPRPAGVIAAATPAESCNLDSDQKRLMHEQGSLSSPSSRTGQDLRVGVDWLDEMELKPADFDLSRAISRASCPTLIVHGDADSTVPVAAACRLAAAAAGPTTLKLITGASHTFDAPNPLLPEAPLPPATRLFIAEVVRWTVAQTTPGL